MGLFTRKKVEPAAAAAAPAAVSESGAAPDGVERLTANAWAKKLNLNEVQAERAAMRAGKWHALFTEEEFLDLIRTSKV